MAIASSYRTECRHCDEEYQHGYDGQYCSEDCLIATQGQKAIRNIEQDHRFCSSCFRPLKTVYRPADSRTPDLRKKALIVRESFVGFQDRTEFSNSGDFGLECDCGNVDHYHSEDLLRDSVGFEWYLKLVFEKFRKEGQIEDTFDLEVFCDTFWQTDDFELAVGRALR